MSVVIVNLEAEREQFVRAFKIAPTRVYLGREQSAMLKHVAAQFDRPTANPEVSIRPRWCGMPVYEVDAERWIGFGVDAGEAA